MRFPSPTLRPVLVATALLASPAASAQDEGGVEVVDRVVALVNGEMITLSELQRQIVIQQERLGIPDDPAALANLGSQVLDGMVDNALILQVAAERGLRVPERYFDEWKEQTIKEMNLADDEEFVRQVELQGTTMDELRDQFMEGILIQEIRRQDIEEKVQVSEPEIEQRYRDRIEEFVEPPQVRLRELVVHVGEDGEAAAEAKLREASRLVEAGGEFEEVARVHSESDSRDNGGALGLFRIEELDQTLREAVEGLEVGEVSAPVRLGDSLYLLRVDERTEESTIPLDEVRNQLAEGIYGEKLAAEMDNFVRELRENAIIEVRLEDPAAKSG